MRHIVSRFSGRDSAAFRAARGAMAVSSALLVLLTALLVTFGGVMRDRTAAPQDNMRSGQSDLPPGAESRDGDATNRSPQPLRGIHIVVDPGHGGHDRGACHSAVCALLKRKST